MPWQALVVEAGMRRWMSREACFPVMRFQCPGKVVHHVARLAL